MKETLFVPIYTKTRNDNVRARARVKMPEEIKSRRKLKTDRLEFMIFLFVFREAVVGYTRRR